MKIIQQIDALKSYALSCKKQGKTIGLVPTMGYLHAGHQSLIRKSAAENDITIVSIFVNPTQFGVGEDFESYPRDLAHDTAAAEAAGASVIFHPTAEEMYPKGYHTYVSVQEITSVLCGKSRPTHFQGVTTVVSKLFHISHADRAYFGQKDAQQLAVIMRMATDLNMDTIIVPCPIVREPDGLAMSSRNTYLSAEERKQALVLSQGLYAAEKLFADGERSTAFLKETVRQKILTAPLARIDYVELLTYPELTPCETVKSQCLLAVAVKFGTTRLIDNILLEGPEK